jgi:hypothetical protein
MSCLIYAVLLPPTELVRCMAISLGWLPETTKELTMKECHIIQDKMVWIADSTTEISKKDCRIIQDMMVWSKVSNLTIFDNPKEWIIQKHIIEILLEVMRSYNMFALPLEYVAVYNLLGSCVKTPLPGTLWDEKVLNNVRTNVETVLRTAIKCPLDNYGMYVLYR